MFAQIIAIFIFLGMFLLIILDKFERHYVTLGSGALVLTLVFGVCMHSFRAIWETLNLGAFFQRAFWYGSGEESAVGINWSTIVFIAGMMIMVEGLGRAGFFRWLCLSLARLVHYRIVPLLVCFMTLSALLSMFIDSITVVLFLATVTLELAQTMRFDPVPMILSEIFCANIGGSATMCGDPPNIIIGTSLVVYPAAGLVRYVRPGAPIYLIDPKPSVSGSRSDIRQIVKGASAGMEELMQILEKEG